MLGGSSLHPKCFTEINSWPGREWLTSIIRDVHVARRGTYEYRRVHAELTQAHGVFVRANLVNLVDLVMHNAAIAGLPGPVR
jgi:hypothetical protein